MAATHGDPALVTLLERVVGRVSKSGEVWVEVARLHLNPHSAYYDTREAGEALTWAL